MTIHERMVPRSEREKDLLKYGRGQERERIIKLLEDKAPKSWHDTPDQQFMFGWLEAIALIKGETDVAK